MSIFQGAQQLAGEQSQQSQSGSTQSSSTQYAPFAEDYLSKLATAGTAQIPTQGQELIAPQSALSQAAFQMAPSALERYKSPLDAATASASGVAGGISPEDIARFYNPYEQQVVDEMARQSAENVQRSLMPQLKAGFVGSGGLGSQRYAGAMGQTLADVQGDLLGQQAKARQAGYAGALDAALREAGYQNQASQILGQLGTAEQQAAVSGLKSLSDLGTLEQAYGQSKIEAPIARLQNIGQILRGYQMQTSSASGSSNATSSGSGKQYSYGASPLSQIAGTASLIGAVKPAANWLGSLFGGDTRGGYGESGNNPIFGGVDQQTFNELMESGGL